MEGIQDNQSKIEENIESEKDLYRTLLDFIENEDESISIKSMFWLSI